MKITDNVDPHPAVADTLLVTKKLHDVQKNSSQDLLSKDSITYGLLTTTNNAPSPFVIEPQSK